MYSFDSRVRYSEVDEDRKLSLTGVINYMQDCSTFQSEDLNMGIDYLTEKHRAWLLSSWQIIVDRYPKLGERIVVSTWPYAFKGIYGYRNFTIQDPEGNYLVRANSNWFFFDTESGCPVRVGEEDVAAYGIGQEEKLPMAPEQFIKYFEEDDHPQVKADVGRDKGMGISIGRLREDSIYDFKFIGLSHNTVRGAAGGAILCAETLKAKGCITKK